MKDITVKLKNKKASALIFSLIVIAALLIYSGAFVAITINQSLVADIFQRRAKALNLAEAGLDHALYWLRSQPTPPAYDSTNPWGGVQSAGGGTYSVFIDDLGPLGVNPIVRKYKVTSTGAFGNFSRVLENYLKVNTFGAYLWWTNSETFDGTNVWFWTQDRLNGATHTNNHFNIFGNPTFGGLASSVDPYIYFYNGDPSDHVTSDTLPDLYSNPPHDVPVFEAGANLNGLYVDMPEVASNLRAAASSGGTYLSGNSTVVFNSTGKISVTNKNKACSTPCTYSSWSRTYTCQCDPPANGAFFVNNGTLTISGTVNANMTVGSSGDIIINNNIVYADDPRLNIASDDKLGIIAERDVVINDNISAEDLEIDAAIMALNSSFMLNDYTYADVKGTLTVYGGIVQKNRGPVGTFYSNGQKASGYSKDYYHDPRFTMNPPPFMPNTGDYDTLSWEEK